MGRAQAKAFYEAYHSVKFDRVYTSSLKRTHETVIDFINSGIPHEIHSGLNEISWGVNEGHRITPDEDAYYHWMLQQWQNGNTSLRINGGESPDEVAARQLPVIQKFLKSTDKTILVCMHGRAIRILLCQLLHYPLKSMDMFEHTNLCLYLLNCEATVSVVKYNDTAHLARIRLPKTELEEPIL